MKYITSIDQREFEVEILDEGRVKVNGKEYAVDLEEVSEGRVFSLLIEGRSVEAYVYPAQDGWQVLVHGRFYPAMVEDERERSIRSSAGSEQPSGGEITVKAPMPGLVVSVPVVDGQSVTKGDVLIVLESMKMQNELKSPRTGLVTRVRVAAGDRVEQQAALMTIT